MSYLGNNPEVNAFTIGVERFSGDSACTEFTLTRSIDDAKAIEIVVGGSQLDPLSAYTVTNGVITFTVAPASGTNNIVVTYRAPVVVTYNQVSATQLLDGSVVVGKLGPGAVTETKVGTSAITTSKIAPSAVTGDKIAITAVNASNTVVPLSITGNLLGTQSVSGNNLGLYSISANNFLGGAIQSNVLASNLSISVSRVTETLNINSVVIGSNTGTTNVNIDVLNTTVYYFSSNTTGNLTLNLRGNNSTIFDQAIQTGNSISVVVTLRHNTSAGRAGVNVMIDGGLIRTTRSNPDIATGNILFYAGNVAPAWATLDGVYPSTTLETNVIGLNIFKKGSNSYFVLQSNTLFGLS